MLRRLHLKLPPTGGRLCLSTSTQEVQQVLWAPYSTLADHPAKLCVLSPPGPGTRTLASPPAPSTRLGSSRAAGGGGALARSRAAGPAFGLDSQRAPLEQSPRVSVGVRSSRLPPVPGGKGPSGRRGQTQRDRAGGGAQPPDSEPFQPHSEAGGRGSRPASLLSAAVSSSVKRRRRHHPACFRGPRDGRRKGSLLDGHRR